MSPFGFIMDGTEDDVIVDKEAGLFWHSANEYNTDPRWDSYKPRVEDVALEYGLPSSDWEWN